MTMRILCLRLQPYDTEQSARRNTAARSGESRSARHATAAATIVASPAEIAARRKEWADDLEEFSPLLGWVAGLYEPCLVLEVGRTSHWFGGEAKLLSRLKGWAADRRLVRRAAIADTLGAAWGAAHFGLPERPGLHAERIVAPGDTAAALSPLPIEALRPAPETAALLRELGIDRVGRLLALSRTEIARRFEPDLLLRVDQALGTAEEVFAAHRPAPRYEAAEAWEGCVTSAEIILAVWERLLPRLVGPLAEQNCGISRLSAELIGESQSAGRLVVGLLRPALDPRHLRDLLQLRLEAVRLREPVVGTRLAVLEAAPLAQQQQVLFAELAPPTESEAWSTLVERLSGRLGPDAVLRVRARDDHQPERAWRGTPWLRRETEKSPGKPPGRRAPPAAARRAAPLTPIASGVPRPACLLPEPRPIRVFAVAPQGHPHQFHDEAIEHRVVRSWGPERIETGWWRGPSVRRDYFRVETEAGLRAWLFRDLRRQRWYLHGWFD
jgi:protein ImuB